MGAASLKQLINEIGAREGVRADDLSRHSSPNSVFAPSTFHHPQEWLSLNDPLRAGLLECSLQLSSQQSDSFLHRSDPSYDESLGQPMFEPARIFQGDFADVINFC